MKVVISGYYGFDNLGDEAILKAIITSLKEVDNNIDVTVLSNNPIKTKNSYNVNAINRWNIKEVYKAIKDSNGLISGGGSLLQDVTSSRSILYYTFIMELANLINKPVFIYAQGIGPINKNINKKIVKYFLNRVKYITLRDIQSFELIRSIGVSTETTIVPDPVMGLKFENIKDMSEQLDYIIVSIREWKTQNDYLYEIAKACDEIYNSGINIKLLPMHGKLDEETCIKLKSIMKNEAEVISSSTTFEQKLDYIKNAKLVIGMRLHALIFAGNLGTPMIGISYDPKIESYLQSVDQKCVGSINDKIDSKKLVEYSMNILKNHKQEQEKLIEITNELKITARLTANKAIEIFNIYNDKGENYE